MNKFEVGDKVCLDFDFAELRNEFDIGYKGHFTEWEELKEELEGTICSIVNKQKSVVINVDWFDGNPSTKPTSHKPQELISISEAEQKYNKMAKDYKNLSLEISRRITEASNIINGAAKLLDETDFDCLADFVDECDPLMDALSAGGWSSSSLLC